MSRGRQPDCRMAMQESCELDMARSVRDMSSLSWVPNMDRRLYTISTCWTQSVGILFFFNRFFYIQHLTDLFMTASIK